MTLPQTGCCVTILALGITSGCGDDDSRTDTAELDTSTRGGVADADDSMDGPSATDASATDASATDASATDASTTDASTTDASTTDASTTDASGPDASTTDASTTDASTTGDASDTSDDTGGDGNACHCVGSTITIPVLPDARDVKVADLDADGHLDIVVAARYSDAVQLHFGDGAGGFAAVELATPHPSGVALGDLDGDDALDLVVVREAGEVTAWLNDGFGVFDSAGTWTTPYLTGEVVLADVDDDGSLDAVVAITIHDADMVQILFGDGAGGFAAVSGLTLDFLAYDLRFGDVDGDGVLDIAARTSQHVLVAFGGGSGFEPDDVRGYAAPVPGSPGAPRRLDLGDVDEDGHLDVVSTGGAGLWLRRGTGTTALGQPELLRTPDAKADDVHLLDLDGDGHLDIVVVIANDVAYALGDGTGGFSGFARATGGTIAAVSRLAHGDLDGDGTIDIVALTPTNDEVVILWGSDPDAEACEPVCGMGVCGDGQVDLLTEECDGEEGCVDCQWAPESSCGDRVVTPGSICYAAPFVRAAPDSWEAHGLDGADIDEDGRLEIVVGLRDDNSPTYDRVYWSVYRDLGEGAFSFTGEHGQAENLGFWQCQGDPRITLGPLDGDDLPDLVLTCSGHHYSNSVRAFSDGNGSFVGLGPVHASVNRPEDAVVGDFDEDGDLDIVTAAHYDGAQIVFNNGSGSFSFLSNLGDPYAGRRVVSDDFDEDGHLDVIVSAHEVAVYLGDGTGVFANAVELPITMFELALVDVDGDGDLDVVGFGGVAPNAGLHVLRNDGTATFTIEGPLAQWNANTPVTAIVPLEADGDGVPDLVVTRSGQFGGIDVLLGVGDGTFEPPVTIYDLGGGMRGAFALDVDGDGLDDIYATRTNDISSNGSVMFFRSNP